MTTQNLQNPQGVFKTLYLIFQKTLKEFDGDKFMRKANIQNDLGVDSLDIAVIITLVEEAFDIDDIPEEEMEKFQTVKDIIDYVILHKSPPTELDPTEILNVLPHGQGFIMINKVESIEIDTNPPRIIAIKNVSSDAWWAKDHFPKKPTMPGNMILEGLCQTAAILAAVKNEQLQAHGWVTGYNGKIRFKRQVVPGDILKYYAELLKYRLGTFTFDVWAEVNGYAAVTKFQILLSTPKQ